jgi:plasmid replication initiation protein
MKKSLSVILGWLSKKIVKAQSSLNQSTEEILNSVLPESSVTILPPIEVAEEDIKKTKKNVEKKPKSKPSKDIVEFDPRDMMEVMEVPFLALSKNRTKPIVYESKDGKTKVKVSAHREHYLASIYDWDIIEYIAGKIQEMMNSASDIPPRTLVIPRHKLIKFIRKHDVKKTEKEIEAALSRLRSTLIETTIRNEDYRYRGGFGFLDSWGYTERKDVKEFQITLSQWLYDGICRKGALLKVSHQYFDLTSGLKKFLYRTARKHVGNNSSWEFSAEKLHEKSGSEREFKKFKHDLKKVVLDNDIPGYFLEWKEGDSKAVVSFINKEVNKEKKPKKVKTVNPKIIKNHVNSLVSALKMPSNVTK